MFVTPLKNTVSETQIPRRNLSQDYQHKVDI